MTRWDHDGDRALSPFQKLLVAALVCAVIALAASMALVARSQVQKAELRAAAEATVQTTAMPRYTGAANRTPNAMTVGYTASR